MRPRCGLAHAILSIIALNITWFALGFAQAEELTPDEWYAAGAAALQRAQSQVAFGERAKNVILFVGDGMGITTITAARILDGQMKGGSGEENSLAFEAFPNVALSKTYSVNQQTPDSAPTMTAMITGVKTNDGVISINHRVERKETRNEVVKSNSLTTLLERAESAGLSTGVVSTARVTHATPAACYAHASERDWEGAHQIPKGATVSDIAKQLIEFPLGDGLEVALGGGRAYFYTDSEKDPEYPLINGTRNDGRSLWREWATRYSNAHYVWNQAQFAAIDPAKTDHLLGLFEPSHMQYEADRAKDAAGEPSLEAMTEKAIRILARNPKGYFLMVEAGRIDHAHHQGNAYRALTDTIALSRAVEKARSMVDLNDTLIIVTADHSHVFTMAGYPKRGNPILGTIIEPGHEHPAKDLLGLPFTTLGYANGPGYHGESDVQPAGPKKFGREISKAQPAAGRADLSKVDTAHPDHLQESAVPLKYETHGGEDVGVFAIGPGSQWVRGVMEQNVIFHVMREALGFK